MADDGSQGKHGYTEWRMARETRRITFADTRKSRT